MSSLLLLLLSAALIQAMVLAYVPAWRPFAGVSDAYESSLGLAWASGVALVVTAALGYALLEYVLAAFELLYLRTAALLLLIAALVCVIEAVFARSARWRPARPGFLLLVASHCGVLGVAALAETRARDLFDALKLGVGAGLGYAFMLLAFVAIHERLRHAAIPAMLRDAPIALITAGIMALAFMGFSGLIQE